MNLEQPNTTRSQAEQWYLELYSELTESAYKVHKNLFVMDCHRILDELAAKIPKCRCKSRDSFRRWCGKFVRRRVQQIKDTETLLAENRKVILAAAYRANDSRIKDAAVELDDLYSEVASQIYQNASDLIKEGIAKPSTRLYALARLHVLDYFTMPRKRRHALITAHIASGGKVYGAFSEDEISAEKWSERESSCS